MKTPVLTTRFFGFLGLQRSTAGLLAMVVLVGVRERMAERFLPIYLYYLIRDVVVAFAALGGAFLWRISPEANLVTAFVFGVAGTVGFAVFGRGIRC